MIRFVLPLVIALVAALPLRPAGMFPAPPPGVTLPEVEPVITDEEFESTVPDLETDDPAMDGPLESIEA